MYNSLALGRNETREGKPVQDLARQLSEKLIGQPEAIEAIVPYVQIYQAGLAPAGRPAGVFLLLGPTGTGKTRTVEALAEVLHGSEKAVLKIDCGEFQLDHEVAKLIGAPPGYLGHRETQPLLTQQKLNLAASERSSLSLVLFDEIEKAAPSLTRLLLGVLDKAVLRLGDNTTVNFERSLIFFTSNLGGTAMMKQLRPVFGFEAGVERPPEETSRKLGSIGEQAARKKFSPEFLNRIDRIITYRPLGEESLAEILDLHIEELRRHVSARLGPRSFEVEVPEETRRLILRKGTSLEYGARELKRTLQRHLVQPLAAMLTERGIQPGARVRLLFDPDRDCLALDAAAPANQ
jgi:ATP-dependent Clp protease ATP-binding subunit ClpA